MAVSAAERQFLLAQLERFAQTDLENLWKQAEQLASEDFFSYVRDAFPDIADTYSQTAGQLAATWFEESDPASPYVAKVADPIVRERLVKSAEWALGGDGRQALDRMSGTLQRAVYDGARETTVLNVEATDSRFIRVARPDACPFCRMLATRTGEYAYKSKKSAGVEGRKYHDFCHCQAVEVRSNQTVDEVLTDEQRKLFQQWSDEYEKATANAGTTANTKKIMSEWRSQIASTPTGVTKLDRSVLDNASTVEQVGDFIRAKHGINVDGLIKSPMAQGIPIDTSIARGTDVLSAAKAAKPHFIDARTAKEFAQSIDDVLTDLPYLELDEFKADFYPSGNPLGSMAHAGQRVGPQRGTGASRVVINQFADAEGDKPGTAYERYRKSVASDLFDNRYKEELIKRPAYAVGVHEVGHVVHFNGGDPNEVTTNCFKALREHIMQTPEAKALRETILRDKPGAFERLAGNRLELMPEYEDFEKQWFRDNLVSAYSFKDNDRNTGIPDGYEMLSEAFADVRLRGEKAETASKIVHRVMVDAAEKNKAKN